MPEVAQIGESVLEGFPYAVLSVHSQDDVQLSALVSRYDLIVEKSPEAGVSHIRFETPEAGEHKSHAVFLFAVALELSARLPDLRLYLHEIDQMREELDRQASTAGVVRTDSDRRISDWLMTDVQLSVEPRTTAYLQQAGYPIDREEHRLDLAPYYVRGLRRVVHESALDAKTRSEVG